MSDLVAISSKPSTKAMRVAQRIAAAQALRKGEFWTESVVAEWMALRTAMFAWLEMQEISYHGTRDAIVSAIRLLGLTEAATDLIFLYHLGTLAEWDEDFEITEQQANMVQKICYRIRMYLSANSPVVDQ